MAGWLDYLNQQSRSRQTYRAPTFRPSFGGYRPQQSTGYDPTAVSRSSTSLFSSGSRAPSVGAAPYTPASAPERIDASLPYTPYVPAGTAPASVTPQTSKGDVLGSILGAFDSSKSKVTIGNAIPWVMERAHELAKVVGADNQGSPIGSIAQAAETGTGAFLDGFEKVSNIAAPILDALPNYYRDTQLQDRAKLYRSIISGQEESSFGPFGFFASGTLIPGTYNTRGAASQYASYRNLLQSTTDPNGKLDAQTQIAMLRDAVDLPESVKNAIAAAPNASDDQLKSILDSAPEGRQWSYDPGLGGMAAQLGNPLLFYGAEAVGLSRLGPGMSGGLGEGIAPALVSRGGVLAKVGVGLAQGVSSAAKVGSVAAKIQKAYMLAGLGTTALTTSMDAVARYQGNQAAIDWFQKVNQPGEFAENPNVQLVSGFTVNPFEAVGAAKRGVIHLANGTGKVFLGKTLGEKFLRYHNADEMIYGQLSKMYRLGGVAEAKTFADKWYNGKGEALDEVVGLAADHVLETKLPREERLAFLAAHPDPVELTKAILSTYGHEIMDALEHHPDEIAQRWFRRSWEYHQYPGQFQPEVAAANARDFRLAKGKTFVLRQQIDAVVGYQEFLPPEAASRARLWLEQSAKDGTVAVEGPHGLQDLVRQFPAMRKYWQGLVQGGEKSISKDAVETMIQRGEHEYAAANKTNPVLLRTGADPVIRPNSPRRELDLAEAVGTTRETIQALEKPTAETSDLLRTYLTEKVGVDPAVVAGMDAHDVYGAAAEHYYNKIEPWVQAGDRVVAAEKRVAAMRAELLRLRSITKSNITSVHGDEIARVGRDLGALMDTIRYASDPIVPFVDDIGFTREATRNADRVRRLGGKTLTTADETFLRRYISDHGDYTHGNLKGTDLWDAANEVAADAPRGTGQDLVLAEKAARKVEAIATLDRLTTLDDAAGGLALGPDWMAMVRRAPSGDWTWSGGKPPVTVAMRSRLASWFRRHGNPGIAQTMSEFGDEELWNIILRQHPESQQALTRPMRSYVSRMMFAGHDLGGIRMDEFAQDAVDRGVVATDSEFLDRVFELANEHEALLAEPNLPRGLERTNLQRTARLDVPPEYLTDAQGTLDGSTIYYDPTFESVIHPDNVAKVAEILANPSELYPALRSIVSSDPMLTEIAGKVAMQHGASLEAVLRDPTFAGKLHEMVPADFQPRAAGPVVETELDALIQAGDVAAIGQRSEEILAASDGPHEPITTTVSRAKRMHPIRPTTVWSERIAQYGVDLSASPDAAILADPANARGLDVLSILNHGGVGSKPATIRGTLHLLRSIEQGNGVKVGLGAEMQAEGQRVADLILRTAVADAKRAPFLRGTFNGGLDPAAFATHEWELAQQLPIEEIGTGNLANLDAIRRQLQGTLSNDEIIAGREAASQRANAALGEARGATPGTGGALKLPKITYSADDPLGSLQYGFKKRPVDAVVLELAKVPGLAEELVTNHFQTWQERVWTARARQAYNYVFGPLANGQVTGAVRERFAERLAAKGIDAKLAEEIWNRWKKEADNSREPELLVDAAGRRKHYRGDNPLYASVGNIPNGRMDEWAHSAIDDALHRRGQGMVDPQYRDQAHTIDYSAVFRESSSFTRRNLMDLPTRLGHPNLGTALSGAYGTVFHNKAVTTMYYWFRFGLDVRYHAMNFFESQLLYLGRAGLRKGEIDTGMLGQTEGFLRKMDADFIDNTGYATSRSRFSWAYRTFLKEQPDAIRGQIKGLQAEDPALLETAMHELASADPELRRLISDMGDTPQGWMKAMDEWHGKLLDSVTEQADGSIAIDKALSEEIAKTPAMAEIYGQLSKANKDLWGSVRDTFYGNANRSRAERFLNSYLLFWPLSYQVKSSKWLMRVLFDRAGGLPTNAAGAVILDRAAQAHQQLLATDQEYRDWYEKHPTMVFVAQMLLPITPDSMGVSLNPALRSMFFGRSKAFWDIGPIYTVNHVIKPMAGEIGADVFPALKDMPGLDGIYRATTGQQPKPDWSQP